MRNAALKIWGDVLSPCGAILTDNPAWQWTVGGGSAYATEVEKFFLIGLVLLEATKDIIEDE